MAISSTSRVAGPFLGDGVTSTFPFTFKVLDAADLFVARLTTASGAIAVLALTTDYSVVLNADQDTAPGGSITLVAGALAVGTNLMITTATAAVQAVDLQNGGAFYPDTINGALDYVTILVQQLAVQLGRAIQVPFGDNTSMTLPTPGQRAGKLLSFDAAGNVSLITVAPGAGTVPAAQAASGAVDRVNTAFTFVAGSGPTPSAFVFVGGIFQSPSDYSINYVSGTTWRIDFVNAPEAGPITVALFS